MVDDKRLTVFSYIIGLSAFLIAACSASISVYGLSMLFSGASLVVMILASSLELGKLITASFLYRYWKQIHFYMKLYLIPGLFVLMFITSLGIYGFLSGAFQKSTLDYDRLTTQLTLYNSEKIRYENMRNDLKSELDALPDNYITARRELREQFQPKFNEIQIVLDSLNTKIINLRTSLLNTSSDIGPITFVSKAFNLPMDMIVKYLIFVLIFVFDPLAVMLIIATNFVIEHDKKKE